MKCKTEEAKEYNWKNVDERWLLIVANGVSVFSLFGKEELVDWGSDEISLIRDRYKGKFDRVFLWDRVLKWHKEI